ncbi:hypothetical protein FB446DRAFT_819079 [Lentinula raphanica]|nr:hypothetical protein FB446DRAFT_819079 [Lentinula raphanica]
MFIDGHGANRCISAYEDLPPSKIAIIDLLVKSLYLETRTPLSLQLLPIFPTSRSHKVRQSLSLSLSADLPKNIRSKQASSCLPNMQPLRPIRPTISLLRLLLLALVLRSSVFDHLVGVSLGVFAAPTSPKSRPPPTILITGATPPMDPANSNQHQSVASVRPNHVLNPDSVQVPFELLRWSQDRSKRREGSPFKDNEKVQGWIKEYLMYTHDGDEAIFTTDTGRGGRNSGASMGTITFRSPTTLPDSLERMRTELAAIKTDKVVSALFFIAFGVFLLEEDPDVDVQMEKEWYVMLRDMILMGVSGEGSVSKLPYLSYLSYLDSPKIVWHPPWLPFPTP